MSRYKVKGQGHQGQISSAMEMHSKRSLEIMSFSSRWDHCVAAGGDGSAQTGRGVIYVAACVTACGLCLLKYL